MHITRLLLPALAALLLLSSVHPGLARPLHARRTVHRHRIIYRHRIISPRHRTVVAVSDEARDDTRRDDTGAVRVMPLREQLGVASWYGENVGPRTADGERFNPRELTAAHRWLPMNTQVRVTNLRNGRTVTVRINDRLPPDSARIIDLTPRAAAALGMMHTGIAKVVLEAVNTR